MTPTHQSTQEPLCQESLIRLERRIIGGYVVLLLAVIALGIAGCSKLRNENSTGISFETGKTYKFKCPSNGKESTVWGTDTYTLDSSICNAAVHAGQLAMESGGSVTIELRPGESSYQGSTRNGIKTNDYGRYGSSFVVK